MTDTTTPSACHVCGRHAIGISAHDNPPRWLCRECVDIIDRIRSVKRLDAYELKARAGGMEAAAGVIEQYGTDLGAYDEHQALELCGIIWRGCADEMRRLIKEGSAPF